MCQCLRCCLDLLFLEAQEYLEIQQSPGNGHALAPAISWLLCNNWTRNLGIALQERAPFFPTLMLPAELLTLFDSCLGSLSIFRVLRFGYWRTLCGPRWIDWLDQLRRAAAAIWHSYFGAPSSFSGVSRGKLAQHRTCGRWLGQAVANVNIRLLKRWDFPYHPRKLKQCISTLRCHDYQSEGCDGNARMWWWECENVATVLNDSSTWIVWDKWSKKLWFIHSSNPKTMWPDRSIFESPDLNCAQCYFRWSPLCNPSDTSGLPFPSNRFMNDWAQRARMHWSHPCARTAVKYTQITLAAGLFTAKGWGYADGF